MPWTTATDGEAQLLLSASVMFATLIHNTLVLYRKLLMQSICISHRASQYPLSSREEHVPALALMTVKVHDHMSQIADCNWQAVSEICFIFVIQEGDSQRSEAREHSDG